MVYVGPLLVCSSFVGGSALLALVLALSILVASAAVFLQQSVEVRLDRVAVLLCF